MSKKQQASEPPPSPGRTPEEINAEYAQVCTLLGDISAKKMMLARHEATLLDRIAELDKELTGAKPQ